MARCFAGAVRGWANSRARYRSSPWYLSLVAAILLPLWLAEEFKPWAAVGIRSGDLDHHHQHSRRTWVRATHKYPFATGVRKLGNSHWAMILGHVGLAVSVGIACTQNYSIKKICACRPVTGCSLPITSLFSPAFGKRMAPDYDELQRCGNWKFTRMASR
ncbi:cytochrome c-type biogenesis CcmF C-terminal domain-containing protein [Escherichia coli]